MKIDVETSRVMKEIARLFFCYYRAMNIQTRLFELRQRRHDYLEAERAILAAQSYEMDGVKLTRADLAKVREGLAAIEKAIAKLEAMLNRTGRSRMRVIVPTDRR